MVKVGRRSASLRSCAVLSLFALAAGCKPNAPPNPPPAPPPPAVTVAHPVQREVIEWDEYTGWLEAVDFVDVRARVGGMLVSVPFQEGSIVQQGDLLAEIDVRPYQYELEAQMAAAAEAEAQLRLDTIEYNRIEAIPESSRSATELDTAAAQLQRARALVAAAKAKVDAARLSVEWCKVLAPITGRVGAKLVTEGNLISGGSGQATLLTTIASVDPIYCYIDADERSVLKYAQMARAGQRVSARQAQIPIMLELATETGFPHVGYVDFVNNRMDVSTGTVRGRGVFSNADGWLLPGLFARVRIPGSGRYQATLIPDAAVVSDQNQKLVYTVDDQNIVHARPVELRAQFGELRAIASGLAPDDWVIINGIMNARPSAPVTPQRGEFSLESLPPSSLEELPGASSAPSSMPSTSPGSVQP